MADITICKNDLCALKDRCYRYNVKPDNYYQSVSIFQPRITFKDKTGIIECEYFITTKED